MRINHGLTGTRIEGIWRAMKQRCYNPNDPAFKYYGGRGIKMCDRWKDSLINFLEDMGHPDDGLSIDRINNDGDYEPSNCRWTIRATQQRNRRNNHHLLFNGKRQTAMEWSKELKIPHQTIYQRIEMGWPVDKILSKKKNYYKEGLALGGKASALARSQKTHCKNGHEYTPENTGRQKNGRFCRACHRLKEARRQQRIRDEHFT